MKCKNSYPDTQYFPPSATILTIEQLMDLLNNQNLKESHSFALVISFDDPLHPILYNTELSGIKIDLNKNFFKSLHIHPQSFFGSVDHDTCIFIRELSRYFPELVQSVFSSQMIVKLPNNFGVDVYYRVFRKTTMRKLETDDGIINVLICIFEIKEKLKKPRIEFYLPTLYHSKDMVAFEEENIILRDFCRRNILTKIFNNSHRAIEILQLKSADNNFKQISKALGTSLETIKTQRAYISSCFSKVFKRDLSVDVIAEKLAIICSFEG